MVSRICGYRQSTFRYGIPHLRVFVKVLYIMRYELFIVTPPFTCPAHTPVPYMKCRECRGRWSLTKTAAVGFSPDMDDFNAGLKPFCRLFSSGSALKDGVIIDLFGRQGDIIVLHSNFAFHLSRTQSVVEGGASQG